MSMVDRLARLVTANHMAAPAIFMLESSRPLARTGSQLMVFFAPIAHAFFPAVDFNELALLLDEPQALDLILQFIEYFEEARAQGRDPLAVEAPYFRPDPHAAQA
ncbi:MAG: hypothetical protein GMKNLPBB_00287 [Myxococcota bacterium]|nr:hypothetical protein [Myxococcota bacterium]